MKSSLILFSPYLYIHFTNKFCQQYLQNISQIYLPHSMSTGNTLIQTTIQRYDGFPVPVLVTPSSIFLHQEPVNFIKPKLDFLVLLKTLHWLPILHRIKSKLLSRAYKVLPTLAPTYFSDLIYNSLHCLLMLQL